MHRPTPGPARAPATSVDASGPRIFYASPVHAVIARLRMSTERVTAALRGTHAVASEGRMPSLEGAVAWLNSRPLTRADLLGKIVAVQFWTYSCVEWLRTYPYLVEWSDKYDGSTLVVIGVHTPEHSFEHDIANVRRAVDGLGIRYPIAIDNHYAISNAFKSGYTPTLYVVDAKLRIRRHFVGEQGYDDAEQLIRQLVGETHPKGWEPPVLADDAPQPSMLQSEGRSQSDSVEVPDR